MLVSLFSDEIGVDNVSELVALPELPMLLVMATELEDAVSGEFEDA
jgi:hypothetical protein